MHQQKVFSPLACHQQLIARAATHSPALGPGIQLGSYFDNKKPRSMESVLNRQASVLYRQSEWILILHAIMQCPLTITEESHIISKPAWCHCFIISHHHPRCTQKPVKDIAALIPKCNILCAPHGHVSTSQLRLCTTSATGLLSNSAIQNPTPHTPESQRMRNKGTVVNC